MNRHQTTPLTLTKVGQDIPNISLSKDFQKIFVDLKRSIKIILKIKQVLNREELFSA